MRILLFAALCLLAGCGGGALRDQAPGLDVGQAALAGGSPDIALRVSTEALRKSPQDVAALLLQGQSLTELGREAEAESSYHRALALSPDSAEARLGLGRLALAHDPHSAELLFLEVLSREPRSAVALNDLGIARDVQGRHAEAQAAYRQALGVSPDMQAATVNLALSLALAGQADRGLDLLRPLAASPDASPRVRHDFAMVAEIAGDRPAAEAALKPDLSFQDLQNALRSYDALRGEPEPHK